MMLMNTFNKYIFYFIILSLCFLPSLHPISISGYYDEKRIVQLVILFLITIAIVFSSSFQEYCLNLIHKTSKLFLASFLIIFSLGIISSSLATIPLLAYQEVSNYYLLIILAVFISFSVQQIESASKLIIYAIIASAVFYLVSFLASLMAGISNNNIVFADLFSGFYNRRFFNQFQSITFPFLIIASLYLNSSKLKKNTLTLLASLWVMLALISDGRAVIISALFGIILSGIIFPLNRKKWWGQAVIIIVSGTILYFIFNFGISDLNATKGDLARVTSSGRLDIWLNTLTEIQNNPFLGYGPMHYALTPHDFSYNAIAHPHNMTLQLMYEWGIPATILTIFLLCITLFSHIKKIKMRSFSTNKSLLVIALSSSIFSIIMHSQLSGILVMPLSQIGVAIIFGWMIGITETNQVTNNPTASKNTPLRRFLLCIPTIIALIILIAGSAPHINNLLNNRTDTKNLYLQGEYPAYTGPRFWSGTFILNKQ